MDLSHGYINHRNTPFGAALWGNGITYQYMQGYVVTMHPKAMLWDIPHETASSPVVWTKPFITPWLYHPISGYTSLKTGIIPIYHCFPYENARDRDLIHPFFAIPSGNLT